jgi:hypothetical protein
MNGHKYLADTSAFIFLLDRHPALQSLIESEWHYSFVTEIELKGKLGITTKELGIVNELLNACQKIPYSDAIIELTIILRQKHKIKTPDAIIAASALTCNLPLLTFDKDFTAIKSLDLALLEP